MVELGESNSPHDCDFVCSKSVAQQGAISAFIPVLCHRRWPDFHRLSASQSLPWTPEFALAVSNLCYGCWLAIPPAYLIYKGNAVTPVAKEIMRCTITKWMTNLVTNVVRVLTHPSWNRKSRIKYWEDILCTVNEIKCEVCPITVPARYHREVAELWWCYLHCHSSPVSLLPFNRVVPHMLALLCWILHKNPEVGNLLECFCSLFRQLCQQ